ncbi:aquaporin-8, partial [Manacus vitellinus]|uniref:aquaporin-8 n=1 Tax=Manacus vitellinus TaxID=328815 RepID=UPI00115F57CC
RLQPALAHGLALGTAVAVLGDISGGHFNPAVSLGVWLVGGLNMTMLIPYWLSQLCGGVIGAGLVKAHPTGRAVPGPLSQETLGAFAVTVDILAGGGVSGACMNPARAFGPALVANYWDYHWVYWVGPMVAALLVAVLVRLLMGDRSTRLLLW